MPAGSLLPFPLPPLCPPITPVGGKHSRFLTFCHSRFLSLCHSRKFLAGIQSFFCPFIRVSLYGKKPLDSRLKTSGMTEVGRSGMTEGEAVGNDGRGRRE